MSWEDILKSSNKFDTVLRRVNNFKTTHKDSTPEKYTWEWKEVFDLYNHLIDQRDHYRWEAGEEKPQINKDIEAKLEELKEDPRIDEYINSKMGN